MLSTRKSSIQLIRLHYVKQSSFNFNSIIYANDCRGFCKKKKTFF